MITPEEIEAKAKEFEIHTSNVQRDYLFGWFIFGIFSASDLRDTIFLKGGNALRKGYFKNTRYSNDLDFGIPDDIAQETLLAEINKVCDFIQSKAGITFIKDNNRVEEKFTAAEAPLPDLKVYEVRVYFKDFYGDSSHMTLKISMDITRFDKVIFDPVTIDLIHPYSDAEQLACKIRCMKLEEIIATKLKCLLQRQHTADLFDYVYSVKLLGGKLNKEEVVQALVQKTIFDRNPQVLKAILRETPFDFFKEFWVKTIVCAKGVLFSVEEAIASFLSDLDELFKIYPDTGYTDFAYFGPALRVPIMRAGREQTLLKIVYKGDERLVEPYSLKYRQPKGAQPREYLYVYNVSGGSSDPGVRSFIAERIESIENTDQKFEPRDGNMIELCKAGEMPENHYMFDPNRPTRAPGLRSVFGRTRSVYTGLKYKFKCGICGKSFTKRSHDSTIGSHKSKGGYHCSGTYGIYQGSSY